MLNLFILTVFWDAKYKSNIINKFTIDCITKMQACF